MNSTRKGVEV